MAKQTIEIVKTSFEGKTGWSFALDDVIQKDQKSSDNLTELILGGRWFKSSKQRELQKRRESWPGQGWQVDHQPLIITKCLIPLIWFSHPYIAQVSRFPPVWEVPRTQVKYFTISDDHAESACF